MESPWQRRFGLGLITLGLAVGGWFGVPHAQFLTSRPAKRLELLWNQDISALAAAKRLPPEWQDIREVQVSAPTETAKDWLKNLKIPIATRPTGGHRLEVLLLSWEEGSVQGAIIQYNLVDLKADNMIWELGRTFVLEGNPDLTLLDVAEPPPPQDKPKGNASQPN